MVKQKRCERVSFHYKYQCKTTTKTNKNNSQLTLCLFPNTCAMKDRCIPLLLLLLILHVIFVYSTLSTLSSSYLLSPLAFVSLTHCVFLLLLLTPFFLFYADIEMACCCCLWIREQGRRIHSESMQGKDDNAKTKQTNKASKLMLWMLCCKSHNKTILFCWCCWHYPVVTTPVLSIQCFHSVIVNVVIIVVAIVVSVIVGISLAIACGCLLLLFTSVSGVGFFMKWNNLLMFPIEKRTRRKNTQWENARQRQQCR